MQFRDLKVGDMFRFWGFGCSKEYIKISENSYKEIGKLDDFAIPVYNFYRDVVVLEYFKHLKLGDRFTWNGMDFMKVSEYTAKADDDRYLNPPLGTLVMPHIFANARYFIKKSIPEDAVSYCMNDVVVTAGLLDATRITPKKVIFNKPATIVIWGDGTKTVVKVQKKPGSDKYAEKYDKEKGLALCYMKKFLGNDNTFNKVLKEWLN